MRISDWSSDVCSSDLEHSRRHGEIRRVRRQSTAGRRGGFGRDERCQGTADCVRAEPRRLALVRLVLLLECRVLPDENRWTEQLHRLRCDVILEVEGDRLSDAQRSVYVINLADQVVRGQQRSGGALGLRSDAVQYRSEEHTSELQSLMRISYAVFCLKQKKTTNTHN